MGTKRQKKEGGSKQFEDEAVQEHEVIPKYFANFNFLGELIKDMHYLQSNFAMSAASEYNPTTSEVERDSFLFYIIRKEEGSVAKYYSSDLALFFHHANYLCRFIVALTV